MAKEEYKFRGHTLRELQKMTMDEFADLLNARKRRSIKRGMSDRQTKLMKKLRHKDQIKTHARDMIVLPDMVGKQISVYDGQQYIDVEIKPEMIGHYLGEFTYNRSRVQHSAPGLGATRSSKYIPLK